MTDSEAGRGPLGLVEEARRLVEKTTQGEWRRNGTSVDCLYRNPLTGEEETIEVAQWVSPSNGDFIAHAHGLIPALCDALTASLERERGLERMVEELRDTLTMRRAIMQMKVDEDENAIVHKCAVLTFDYVLDEMARLGLAAHPDDKGDGR